MLKNYFTVAWRSLKRQKSYAAINIGGLAVGMACCLLIGLHVWDEWTYDRFHENSDRTVQVLVEFEDGGGTQVHARTPLPLGARLEQAFASVEQTVSIVPRQGVVSYGDRFFHEEVHFSSPSFFEVFSFELRQGDPERALESPGTAVVTKEMAQALFGRSDVLGESIDVQLRDTTHSFRVTGVAETPPRRSSLDFSVLLSDLDLTFHEASGSEWRIFSPYLFAQLASPEEEDRLSKQLPAFTETLREEGFPDKSSIRLLPLTELRLTPDVRDQIGPTTPRTYLFILLSIAGLILLTACINFTTLSISRSAYRAREVGMRKTLGAQQGQIAGQFLSEALLLAAVALLVGIALAQGLMPFFNSIVGKELDLQPVGQPTGALALLGLLLLAGLLAGGYPALYLSRFSPMEVIRHQPRFHGRSRFTQGLVVGQFALAVFLIACTAVMTRQFGLMQTKDLGFDPENVVQISVQHPAYSSDEMLARYRSVLAEQASVQSATGSSLDLLSDRIGSSTFESGRREVEAHVLRLEEGGAETLGLELLEGRPFSESNRKEGVLVSESFATAMGWDDPIGQHIIGSVLSDAPVIGVVADFHFRSFHHPIEPLVLHQHPAWAMPNIYVRLVPGVQPEEALGALEAARTESFSGAPFQHAFMDEITTYQYDSERRWTRVVSAATLLALLIACFGLFGLAAFTAERRTKEIGIRKVLGASVQSIVALLSKDFLKLVVAAFVIAAPIAYWAMSRWLENFAYRIDLGFETFLLAGLLAVAIAFVTVSYQAVKAALTDPVESLRYE